MDALRPKLSLAAACAVALAAGPLVRSAPVPLAVVAAIAVLVAAPRMRTACALSFLGAASLALGAGLGARAIDRFERTLAWLDRAAPGFERCDARMIVDEGPRPVAGGAFRVVARLVTATCEAGDVRAAEAPGPLRFALTTPDAADARRGDVVDAVVQVARPERFWDPAGGDVLAAFAHRGTVRSGGVLAWSVASRSWSVGALVDRARAGIRRRIDATFSKETAPLARALVVGDADVDPEDDAAFRASGLSHLLAVSGMHLILVVGGLQRVLRGALARLPWLARGLGAPRLAALATIPLVWLYADLAGGSGSAVRAAAMTTTSLLAAASSRRTTAGRAFSISLAACALVDPLVVFDLSLVLSAAATAGLLAFARPMTAWLEAHLPCLPESVRSSLGATVAATAACTPVLARIAPTLALGGLFANLVAVPIGEAAALPLCLLHAVLGPCPLLERGAALTGGGALALVRAIARGVAGVPILSPRVPPPTALELALLLGAGLACALGRSAKRAVVLAASCVSLVAAEASARAHARGLLRITFLDVGQGDSALLELPTGEAILLDGGGFVGSPIDPGLRVLVPELRAQRRDEVDLAILSHPHPDHVTGLASTLDAAPPRAVWDTGQGEVERIGGPYRRWMTALRERNIPISRPSDVCGSHALGGVVLEVLAPCGLGAVGGRRPGPVPGRSANDNSFVLRVRYGERAFLFVGDAEHLEEEELVTSGVDLRADVLKVGHHGSRTSSSEGFLSRVAPKAAVISAGIRNRFGHPRAETLAALGREGSRVFRTDRGGAIVAECDGRRISIRDQAGDTLTLP